MFHPGQKIDTPHGPAIVRVVMSRKILVTYQEPRRRPHIVDEWLQRDRLVEPPAVEQFVAEAVEPTEIPEVRVAKPVRSSSSSWKRKGR